MSSIIAGFLIALSGIINLSIGGVLGAIFFSLGLITIVTFKYNLFTGKAGLLATGEIKFKTLLGIWLGNFFGTFCCAMMVHLLPNADQIISNAIAIVEVKMRYDTLTNTLLGFFCGILMYIAVTGYDKTKNYLFCIMPVAFFILNGFNHCVADMFYVNCIPITTWNHWMHLLSTTFGNLIGANLLPILGLYYHREV